MRFSDLLIINPSSTTSLRVVSLLFPLVGLAIYGKVTIINNNINNNNIINNNINHNISDLKAVP